MFKQFITHYADSRIYLVFSLWLFLVFFILVTIMLIKMSRKHTDYMSELPLNDTNEI